MYIIIGFIALCAGILQGVTGFGVFLVNLVYGTIMRMLNHILTTWHLSYIVIGISGIINVIG